MKLNATMDNGKYNCHPQERHLSHRSSSVGRIQRHRSRMVVAVSVAMALAVVGVHGLVLPPSQTAKMRIVKGLHAATPTEDETTSSEASQPQQQPNYEDLFKGYSSSSASTSNNNNNNINDEGLLDQIDAFLDKPLFDPEAYEDDDDSFQGKMARFVKADYELFEALFVACFFLLLITIAKDLLRAQMVASGVVAAGKIF